ncbi:uncharacterized protein [Venturia canescens]|uniref:uncharacterized protein n=1 Tax=Venturia canescens TaxID=32260 RepID=UPI001C9BCDED|nr:uncharacterized protein LOC122411199 [Venturia canescens]XP_043275763.1 uncharacterized protein LOC122411199 [Venturia canescens]
MHGIRRVLIFCALIALLPITLLGIPLYLRHNLYADATYAVTESDILEMSNGISTVFCSAHTLKMNSTFNAFQMDHKPEIATRRKLIRLKKSMILPDDTLEYWGFYLLRGATVVLSVCSRFPGASILVVKGDRKFSTCGMLDHNKNKAHTTMGMYLPEANEQVKITFESNAQLIDFEEPTKTITRPKEPLPKRPRGKPRKHKERKIPENKRSDVGVEELEELEKIARVYLTKHVNDSDALHQPGGKNSTRKLRHVKKHTRHRKHREKNHERKARAEDTHPEHDAEGWKNINLRSLQTPPDRKRNPPRVDRLKSLREELREVGDDRAQESEEIELETPSHRRLKRNQEPAGLPALLDHGIQHGGNALRNSSDESSVSSFEEGLLDCYDGQVLVKREFPPSELCTNVTYLVNGQHMQSHHDVTEDGYYYYIFYSDNDIVFNDIHAVFDIHKPTFQYEKVTNSCLNKTECTFPLPIFSSDRVIVEVPTRDGIDHEEDDISLLVSVCHPRMGVYVFFPIALLFLIISCAFM